VTSRGDSTTWLDFKAKQKRSIDFRNELPGSNNDFLFIRNVLPIDSNRVFLATHSGLLELDKHTRKFRRLKLYHKGYPLDPTPNYYSLFMDEERKVWVLQGIGLVSFSADKESIGLIREREHAGTYIWPNNARNLVEDEFGNIWMATSEGFGYWNQRNNEITMYPAIANARDRLNIPSVRGLYYDKGMLIMGTSSAGVWIYNTKTKSFRRPAYTPDETGTKLKKQLEVDFIKQIIKLPDGNYFVVGRTCYILDKETFLAHDFSIESFTSKQPNFVFIANDQSIWLCTGDGVLHYDSTLHKIQSYYLGKSITAFNEYQDHTFFVGTSKGLFSIDLQRDTVLISDKDKIADFNRVTFIVKDHRDLFWIGANEGLIRLDPLTRQTEIYDYSDNVQGNVWAMEPLFARNGKLFIGGNNGINYFDPDKIEKKNERLQVTIMKVTVNQDDTSYFDRANLLSLKSFQNSLDIQFVAPYYGNPQRLQYRYQMLGLSSEWKELGNNNEVRFSRLPPGDYVFNVSASVNGQQWFQSTEALAFSIAAPFWQQWWFVAACIVIAALLLFLYLNNRIDRIRQKEATNRAYEKKIAEVEMHALRAQMNPHFMFNSLNSINNFILKNDPDNASGYLTKFSRLMRLILDNSRSEWIVLENELKALELYIQLEVVRFDDVFEYELIVDPGVDVTTTFVPPMIIQPYVENAIWHGLLHRHSPGGKLVIRIWRTGDILHINVEDNGVGRQEATRLKSKSATKHKSHGLKITAERIDIVNRIYNVDAKVDIDDLTGQNGTAGGTRVSLTLKDKMHDSYNRG
jgi:ligand-binding sensor domain-containing protein